MVLSDTIKAMHTFRWLMLNTGIPLGDQIALSDNGVEFCKGTRLYFNVFEINPSDAILEAPNQCGSNSNVKPIKPKSKLSLIK